ncbi:MAG: baseplate wedge protein 53 [Candidatus Dormibacteria bacterium]
MYFDAFPQLLYTFDDPSLGNFEKVVNIFVRVKMLDSILNNLALFHTYNIKDSDTPEIIAAKYYNDATRHWMVLFANQIIDPYYQWPLNQANFNQNIIDQFGSAANALSTIDHYEKHTNVVTTLNYQVTVNTYISIINTNVTEVDGSSTFPTIVLPIIQVGANNVVNFSDGSIVDTSVQLYAITQYQNAQNVNESHRNIKLLSVDYANQIEAEFNKLLAR